MEACHLYHLNDQEKSNYLKLIWITYFKDIIKKQCWEKWCIDALIKIAAFDRSTSARKLPTYKSKGHKELSINTVISYLDI